MLDDFRWNSRTGEPGGLLSMGLHRVRHDLAAAAAAGICVCSTPGQSFFQIPLSARDGSLALPPVVKLLTQSLPVVPWNEVFKHCRVRDDCF